MIMEAFMKRGMERQQLLEELLRDLLVEEGRREDPAFLFKIERTISEYLQQRTHNAPQHVSHEIAADIFLCADAALDRIRKFGRSQAEEDALVAELLEKVVLYATWHFRLALRKQEISDPELIFHVSYAMTEVPTESS